MFSLFVMPKRRTFDQFLASSEDNFFFVQKENMFSNRRTYGKPIVYFLYFQKLKFAIIVLTRTQAVKDKWSKLRQTLLSWRSGGIKVDSAIDRCAEKNIIY